MTEERRGALLALSATLLFGASTPFAKRLLGGLDPWLTAGLLYLGAGAGLLLLSFFRRAAGGAGRPLRRGDWGWLGASTAVGGLLAPVCLMAGLARTEAAAASLLLSLEFLFTALLAWGFFGERLGARFLAGAAVLLLGGAVVSWAGTPKGGSVLGPLLIAGACMGWALDNNFTRRIAEADALRISLIKNLSSGIINTSLGLAAAKAFPPAAAWGAACVVGFLGYGVSLVLFVEALRRIGAARAGAYFMAGPFVGAGVAVVLGLEPLTGRLLAGGAILSGGALVLSSEKSA